MANPYFFNLASWEVKHLFLDRWHALKHGIHSTTDREDVDLVSKFRYLKTEIDRLRKVVSGSSSGIDDQQLKSLRDRLEILNAERKGLEIRVKFILESQISLALDEVGLAYPLPVIRNVSVLFPAVAFSQSELPHLLIVSPREKIELKESILLVAEMNQREIESLEKRLERSGVSALVEGVGGIATYPSLIPDEISLSSLLETAAHEWFHQYLFFRPLGWNYRRDYQMRIINETVADIGGREVADIVLRRYYPDLTAESRRRAPARGKDMAGIDFNKEMRDIRVTVDSLLSQGKISEAEKFMEESRINLAKKGFFIRKLNQAYFAFHGSYGEAPASTSPVGPLIRRVREKSDSLGDFIRIVSAISSAEQLVKISK